MGKAKAAAQQLSALEKESKKLRAEQQRAKEDLQRVRDERQRLREQLASVQSKAPAPPAIKPEAEEELHGTLHTVSVLINFSQSCAGHRSLGFWL